MKAGIVGCGAISAMHAAALANMEGTDIAGAADIKPERAQAFCDKYGGNPYSSLEELLKNEKPDVLHICTPHYLHVPMAELAAGAGCAVFTEKPPVISRAQWQRLCDVGKQIPLGICFQNRYNDSVLYIKELLAKGNPGKFLGARALLTWSRDAGYYIESGWRGSLETEGGGVLINQAIHTMDLLVYLLGRPSAVQARKQNFHLSGIIEVEDSLEAYIEYGSSPVLFCATNAYCSNSPVMVELTFEALTLRMEETELSIAWSDGRQEAKSFLPEEAVGKSYWGSSHSRCINDFYNSLKQNLPPPIGILQTTDTVDLFLSAYESADTEKRIVFK